MKLSFGEFMELDKHTQQQLGNKINEELSPEERKKKEIELDALLKKQQEIDDEVKKLESEIGGDNINFTKVYVENNANTSTV